MASPITHIVLALKILHLLPASCDQKAFIVGTSFPDIRYMARLSREITHIEPVSWIDVINEPSSFRAGMLFHNVVDILRIKYFEPQFYDRTASKTYPVAYVTYYPLAMKMAEDAILCSFLPHGNFVNDGFSTLYPEELELCPDASMVMKWHAQLQNYIASPTTLQTLNMFLSGVGGLLLKNDDNSQGAQYFSDLSNNLFFQQKLLDFYNNFEAFLGDEPLVTPSL